jgi:hypothetical protein
MAADEAIAEILLRLARFGSENGMDVAIQQFTHTNEKRMMIS